MYYVNLFALISMDLRDFVYIIACLGLHSPATLWHLHGSGLAVAASFGVCCRCLVAGIRVPWRPALSRGALLCALAHRPGPTKGLPPGSARRQVLLLTLALLCLGTFSKKMKELRDMP